MSDTLACRMKGDPTISRSPSDTVVFVIVSDNMVEATDLTELLANIPGAETLHYRSLLLMSDSIDTMRQVPDVAFVSASRRTAGFRDAIARLHDAGTRLVLINGNPEVARETGAAFLQRPFSSRDVDAILRTLL